MLASNAVIHLGQYQWKNRVILVFSPGHESASALRQNDLFASGKSALVGRDAVVLAVDGNAEPALRRQFHAEPAEFLVVLIGKDGGEKHRWNRPVTWEEVSALIDKMPMRREETKRH